MQHHITWECEFCPSIIVRVANPHNNNWRYPDCIETWNINVNRQPGYRHCTISVLNIFLNIKGLKNYYQVIRSAPQFYMLPKYEISTIVINYDSNNGVMIKRNNKS